MSLGDERGDGGHRDSMLLPRSFGSKSGDRPRFTAEAEGDDYLFGPPPGSKYAGVGALWNADQHAVDPTYAPREEWSIIDAETIAHDRKPAASSSGGVS